MHPERLGLSHLDQTMWKQITGRQVANVPTAALELARAYLADVILNEASRHLELAGVRGQVIEAELRARRESFIVRLRRGRGSPQPHLTFLTSLPDKWPPHVIAPYWARKRYLELGGFGPAEWDRD